MLDDLDTIRLARTLATGLVEEDPELGRHDDLRAAAAGLKDRADFLEKT